MGSESPLPQEAPLPHNAECHATLPVKTADEEGWSQQVVEQTTQSSLMKRFGDLTDQAAAILFLASEDAAYITGTTLPVAGGDQG
jgi:dihydroxycyclohexadiene carboxylate dehydrogenase